MQANTLRLTDSQRFTERCRSGLCPAGCLTTHGGPLAAAYLAVEWRDWPAETRPSWPDFTAIHGRPHLGNQPPPVPAMQEA